MEVRETRNSCGNTLQYLPLCFTVPYFLEKAPRHLLTEFFDFLIRCSCEGGPFSGEALTKNYKREKTIA